MTTTSTAAPVITLKKIEWSARQSQETNSFVANLYVDGVLLGEVSNDGHGGCDNFYPAKAESRALYDETKARLIANGAENDGFSCPLETAYNEVLEAYLKNKLGLADYRKGLKKTVMFITPGDKEKGVRTYKIDPKFKLEQYVAFIAEKHGKEAIVLNVLPEAEGFPLFMAQMED